MASSLLITAVELLSCAIGNLGGDSPSDRPRALTASRVLVIEQSTSADLYESTQDLPATTL